MPQKIDYLRIGSSVDKHRRFRYASVSQITNFDPDQLGGCNRKWWFDKIGRIKTPQTFAQETGVENHAQIETYLTTGADVLGIVARAGFRFIPKPGPGLHVEMPFGDEKIVELFDERQRLLANIEASSNDGGEIGIFETFDREILAPMLPCYLIADNDVPVLGAIDVVNTREEWIDNEGIVQAMPNGVEVLDWKTSADIDKYAKTGSELIETVQMIGYAKYASQRYPQTNEIRISHGYFQTRGAPRAKKVSTVVALDIIQHRWQHIEQRVKEMKQVAREISVEKVPANLNACSAYRGCAFAAHCPRSTKSTIMAAFEAVESKPMGLLDKLKSDQSLASRANAPASAPTKPPSEPTVAAEIERLKAAEIQAVASGIDQEKHLASEPRGTCKVDGTPLTPENSSKLPDGNVVHIGCKPGVMPPDAPASNPATNAAPVPQEALAALPPNVRTVVENHGATAPVTAPELAPEKRGRGRPPGKKTESATEVHGTTLKEIGEANPSRQLFVDCLVKGRIVVDLSAYIEKLCADLASKFNAADIRCAPSDSPLAFGKWKGALAAAIRENPPELGTYVLHGVRDSEIRQTAVEALEPLCTVFVRGV